MKRIVTTVSLRILVGLGPGGACADELMVGIRPSDGVAMFVKKFPVAAGTTIAGVEFRNNDARTVFPEVVLVRGASSALNEGTVVARSSNVVEASSGGVRVTWAPGVQVTQAAAYFVGVRVPEGPGKRGLGDGPAVGATRVGGPVGSYVATGSEGVLTPALVDWHMNLLVQSGKAGLGEQVVLQTFFSGASPNPFNPSTTIEFGIPEAMEVAVKIYDVAGRQVRRLVQERVTAGTHRRVWDGRDDHGATVAAGIYVVQLAVGGASFQKKIVLMK